MQPELHSSYAPPAEQAPVARARSERGPLLHILLFAATFLTASMQSALSQGVDIFSHPLDVTAGFPFAITLLTILLFHEFGHYFLAQSHRVDTTLPYFIPAPPLIFPIGTLGAFIRIRSLPPHRRALFDIGAAGPWAGFVVAVPAIIFGLQQSEVGPLDLSGGGLVLGESILFNALVHLVLGVSPQDATILLHPVALAGWFGLFVTCLNLLPVGQLDGGHIVYAVFGRHHRWISRGVLTFLVVLGIGGWPGWFVWAFLLMVLGLNHPRPWDPVTPLDRRRLIAAGLTLAVFVLTFMPEPLKFLEPSAQAPVFEGDRLPIRAPAGPPRGLVIAL